MGRISAFSRVNSNTDVKVLNVGGNYNDNDNYGFFYFNANNNASNTNANLGSLDDIVYTWSDHPA